MKYDFHHLVFSFMQKQNLLENVEGLWQYLMGKRCSQYSMSMTHTVYKVKLFILAQKVFNGLVSMGWT